MKTTLLSYAAVTLITFLLVLVSSLPGNSQPLTPKENGLKELTISDARLGLIRFYIDTENLHKKAPIFIEVNGSGGLPLCLYIKGKGFGETLSSCNNELRAITQKKFHYVVLGKPGTPFCDSISTNNDRMHYDRNALIATYPYSAEYTRRLSLEWRVRATRKVITYLQQHGYWDGSKIVAYGYSEGAQVVPALAVADKRITHVVSVVGSGLNQFYDSIIGWRIKAVKGEITQQQAQDSIDVYMRQVADIYRYPENSDKQFEGHSYKRWASFGRMPPFEQLRKLTIPCYMIAGTADEHSPVYGLDYVPLDFIRLGKTNLTYVPCVGCDHFLNSTSSGQITNHTGAYLKDIMKWLGY